MKDYWFTFIPSHWQRDTLHLTPEQEGIYLRLVMYYMEKKVRLPSDDGALARIAAVSLEMWKANSSVLRGFFVEEGTKLAHKKCDKVLKDQEERSEVFEERARTAAEARWKKEKDKKAVGDLLDGDVDNSPDSVDNRVNSDCQNNNSSLRKMLDQPSIIQASKLKHSYPPQPSDNKQLHASGNAQAMLADATGQDRIEQDRKGKKDSLPPESSFKKPPLPPETQSPLKGEGGFKSLGEMGMGGAGEPFRLRRWLDRNPTAEGEIMRDLLRLCPGHDRNFLVTEYDRTADRRPGNPRDPKAAFLGWIKKFYAGKKPGG